MTANAVELDTSSTYAMNFFYHGSHDITPSLMLPQLEVATPTMITTHTVDYSVPLPNKSVDDFDDFEMAYLNGQADIIQPHLGSGDEARYNLATRIMSNGVEVIIAGDKSKTVEANGNNNSNILEQKSQILRIMQTPINKPVTLAPSTLQDQMILVKPTNEQENYTIPNDGNNFITKTCLTTYTYRTTYLQDGHTTVESREKVISNIATEERNYLNLSPTVTSGVVLSRTPEFAVGVFHTSYTYYNTILDGELPLVVSSQHTVTNTITGPDVYISFLQPSENATPVLETNTYYSKVTLTKTLRGNAALQKVVSMSNILTQVIVTESLPSRSTSVMTSYYAFDVSEHNETEPSIRVDANDHNLVTAQPQKPTTDLTQPATSSPITLAATSTSDYDLHIYATKTFLTTFTYLTTTLLKSAPTAPTASITPSSRQPTLVSSTIVNYHTRVMENVITETVPSSLLRSDLLKHFHSELKNPKNERKIIITLATLRGGQTIEITAMNIYKSASTKYAEKTAALTATATSSSSRKATTSSHKVAKISKTHKSSSNTAQVMSSINVSRTTYIAPTRVKATSALSQTSTRTATQRLPTYHDTEQEDDSAVASSEQDNVYISHALPSNSTKTTNAIAKPPTSSSKLPGTVNQLIGSLNLNSLNALRPVFNAMAGLLHNNFRGGVGTAGQHKPAVAPAAPAQLFQIENKHALKNITSHAANNDPAVGSSYNSHVERPIYIPVQNMAYDDVQQNNGFGTTAADTDLNPTQLSPQSLHIQPPAADVAISDDNWMQEVASKLLQYGKLQQQHVGNNHNAEVRPRDPIASYETPLINSGIPISPGEVITANSDVIIGKPNGIQHPRVPYGSENIQDNSAAANTQIVLQPPPEAEPATTFYQHFIQHPPYEKSAVRHNNAIPFLRYNFDASAFREPSRQQQKQQHKNSAFSSATNFDNILKPPALQPNMLPPTYIQPPPPPPPLPTQQHIKQQQQLIAFSRPDYSEHKYYTIEPDQHKLDYNFNKDLQHNEILEIKRIPEVYSTDLPPQSEFDTTQKPAREAQFAAGIAQSPLLVEVQPSRITTVLIPHDVSDASALVLTSSSTRGSHKHGQYYNEPNPHLSVVSNKQPAFPFAMSTTTTTTTPKDAITLQTVHAQAQKDKPFLTSSSNHQKVNFDTHVLSHNVDINAPPLTFKKESEFPLSVPVRGHIPNDMVSQQQSSFYSIPLVKIPLSEENIQVDLTSQNVISSVATPTVAQQALMKQQQQYELDAGTFGSFAQQIRVPQSENSFATAKQQLTSNGSFNEVIHNNNHLNTNYLKAPERHRLVSKNNNFPQSEHVSILENPFTITNELHRIASGAGGPHSYGQKVSPPLIPSKQKPALHYTTTTLAHPAAGPLRGHINNKSNFNEPFHPSMKPYGNYGQRLTVTSQVTPPQTTHSLKSTQRPFLRSTKKRLPSVSSGAVVDQQLKSSITSKPTTTTVASVPPKPTRDYWNQNLVTYEDDLADDTTNTFNDDQNAAPSLNSIRLPAPQDIFLSTQHMNNTYWEQTPPDIILQPFLSEMSMHSLNEMNEKLRTTTTPAPTTIDLSAVRLTKTRNENLYKGILPSQGRPFQASNQTNKWSSSKNNERLKQHIYVATGEGFKKPQATDAPMENKKTSPIQTTPEVSPNRTQLHTTTSASFWELSSPTPASTTLADFSTTPVTYVPIEQHKTQSQMKNKESEDEIFDFYETSNPHNYGSVNTTKTTSAAHNRKESTTAPATIASTLSNKRPTNAVSDSKNSTTMPHNNSYYKYRPIFDIRPPLKTAADTEAVVGLNPPPPPPLPTPINTFSAKTTTPYKTINYTSIKRVPLLPVPQLNNDLKLQTTRQPTKEQVILKPPPLPTATVPNYIERILPSSLTPPLAASNTFKPIQYSKAQSSLSVAIITPALSSTPIELSTSINTSLTLDKGFTEVVTQTLSKAVNRRKNDTDNHQLRKQTTSQNFKPHKTSEHILLATSEVNFPTDVPQVLTHDPNVQSSFPGSTHFEEKKTNIRPTKTSQLEETQSANHKPVQDLSWNSNAVKLPPNQHRANTQILRLSSKRIILPTKFITNTQILTVTTTETTVLTTAGKQSTKTLTLIKTQTATILDTVTEFHTLLQPTRVAETIMHSAKTATTFSTTPSHNVLLKPLEIQPVSYEENDQHLANHKPYHEHKKYDFEMPAAGHPSIEVVLADATVKHQQQSRRPVQQPIADTEVTSLRNNDASSNSIFVVMTDNNSKTGGGGIININPNMLETAHNINAIGVTASEDISATGGTDEEALDYNDNDSFDLPSRDEETVSNAGKADHVLLGGVLIATPPKSSSTSGTTLTNNSKETGPGTIARLICRPACKASRNEVCIQVQSRVRCICRPGFARMFPDRPCKPTYTYAMRIYVHRLANDVLRFERQLMNNESEDFRQLATITHDAVDRMVMQSDFRDVYHGVHLTSFEAGEESSPTTSSKELDDVIIANMLLQLSDNSDEGRLGNVFKKYLRLSNYSIGGTELYTTKNGVENMAIVDFDECRHTKFHDCSANARCFNLQGSYTCSCQEGYVDLSENPIYPGRICSAEIIGCEKCHYHGKCVAVTTAGSNKTPICECFAWYTGASCQLNLKILLIALIAVGTLLFILLLFCVLVTCNKRSKHLNARSLMHASMHKIASKNSLSTVTASRHKSKQLEKRAMIKDSSSETSLNSIPYALKDASSSIKQHKLHGSGSCFDVNNHHAHSHYSAGTGSALITALEQSINELHHHFPEQSDRSLTVMIPRAKYHPTVLPQAQFATPSSGQQQKPSSGALSAIIVDDNMEVDNMQLQTTCNTPISKSMDTTKQTNKSKKMSTNSLKHKGGGGMLAHANVGALVSAGFEVSATVSANLLNSSTRGALHSSSTTSDGIADVSIGVGDNNVGKSYGDMATNSGCATTNEFHQQLLPSYMAEVRKTEQSESHESEYNNYKDGEELIESMDMWLDNIHQTELTAEARSFDETVVQAATKSKRCCFDSSTSQTNDEANTMTERDIGSTFLLPHTHLYKPERQESETSGFDFI